MEDWLIKAETEAETILDGLRNEAYLSDIESDKFIDEVLRGINKIRSKSES